MLDCAFEDWKRFFYVVSGVSLAVTQSHRRSSSELLCFRSFHVAAPLENRFYCSSGCFSSGLTHLNTHNCPFDQYCFTACNVNARNGTASYVCAPLPNANSVSFRDCCLPWPTVSHSSAVINQSKQTLTGRFCRCIGPRVRSYRGTELHCVTMTYCVTSTLHHPAHSYPTSSVLFSKVIMLAESI